MKPEIDIQRITEDSSLPADDTLKEWVTAALRQAGVLDDVELTLRLVDTEEIRQLNHEYRDRDYATNVLSFPAELPEDVQSLLPIRLLGDVVICGQIVQREATEQDKPLVAHWAHMVIHGCLHLLGYDHIEPADAERMEALEIEVLQGLGFANPY